MAATGVLLLLLTPSVSSPIVLQLLVILDEKQLLVRECGCQEARENVTHVTLSPGSV